MYKVLKYIVILFISSSLGWAQTQLVTTIAWPSGNLYCTQFGDPEGMCTWRDWNFIDAQGTSHTFSGSTQQKGILHPDGTITNLRVTTINATSPDGLYFLTATGGSGNIVYKNSAYPKFNVLNVSYVPPGPGSSVDYKNSVSVGVTSTIEKSFSYNINLSVSFGDSIGLDYTHTTSNANEESTTKTNTYDVMTKNNNNFINHDYDQFDVWLNPQVDITYSEELKAQWESLNNSNDTYIPPINGKPAMDHVVLLAGWLNGNIPWPNNDILTRLQRSWDTSNPNPGLTISDFAAILSLNPFAQQIDPITGARLPLQSDAQIYANVMLPGGSQRYTLLRNINYTPVMQSITDSIANIQSSSQTNGSTNTLSITYGFKAPIISGGAKWTWTNRASVKKASSTTDIATFTIVTPDASKPMPSASSVNVYQDNIYGTFMFVFPNAVNPGF